MQEFSSGPFIFTPSECITYNGVQCQFWTLYYGHKNLGGLAIDAQATKDSIREAFGCYIAEFIGAAQEDHAPDVLELIDFTTGDPIAKLAVSGYPGLTPGIIDDRSRYWLRSTNKLLSLDVTLERFAEISATHGAPDNAWIAELLPGAVLTEDADAWRAPTSWELRHVVGEGSFTGVSGAKAAALVGVSPQNFRKYTARDGAASRQSISFAMWHLLLAKLKIQRIGSAS